MKTSLFIKICYVTIFACVIWSCSEDVAEDLTPTGTLNPLSVAELDNIADHLQIRGSVKQVGKSPRATAASSTLKISVKDTLRIAAGVQTTINFLHDEDHNVTDVYVQVQSIGIPTHASYYLEIPELTEPEENDTLSGFAFGFDPENLELPATFDVAITATGGGGEVLGHTIIPVIIYIPDLEKDEEEQGCGLVLPNGDYWSWVETHIEDVRGTMFPYEFYNSPSTIFGAEGQDINGCCIDGVTSYELCTGTPNARRMRFPTFHQQEFESIELRDNGTFKRITKEVNANPLPEISDFCTNDPIVYVDIRYVTSEGKWTIKNYPASVLPYVFAGRENATFKLISLQTTSSDGFTWTPPSGFIITNDCNQLTLLKPDNEGRTNHVWQTYIHHVKGGENWYSLNFRQ